MPFLLLWSARGGVRTRQQIRDAGSFGSPSSLSSEPKIESSPFALFEKKKKKKVFLISRKVDNICGIVLQQSRSGVLKKGRNTISDVSLDLWVKTRLINRDTDRTYIRTGYRSYRRIRAPVIFEFFKFAAQQQRGKS